TLPAQTIPSNGSVMPRDPRSSSARSPTNHCGPGWSSSAAAISSGSTSTPTTLCPARDRAPPIRPGPHPASSTRAPRGTMASTSRASPTISSPARTMDRNRSKYQEECPGSSVTFCIQMLSSTMPSLSAFSIRRHATVRSEQQQRHRDGHQQRQQHPFEPDHHHLRDRDRNVRGDHARNQRREENDL